MPEIEGQNLIASQLVLLVFGHLTDEVSKSLILLQIFTNLLLNLSSKLIFLCFIVNIHHLIFISFSLFIVLVFLLIT
jgi:hypothetical protein